MFKSTSRDRIKYTHTRIHCIELSLRYNVCVYSSLLNPHLEDMDLFAVRL